MEHPDMYSEETIQKVWQKGRASGDQPADTWRQDECGAWIRRSQYGDSDGEFGWKIERVAAGGADDAASLRPFHVGNSYDIAVGRPHCRVTADRTGLAATARTEVPRNRAA
jgi:hypothetical protein